ncbi:aldo/keto reductase [Maricaulis sp.]|uniref:aldo/keto reductase n=1 Tax=Maricaulis sp. TaxID=1486257 RepID=UPI002611D832|nr:aldo/keto reductase [Maricaulis sp.]
MTLPLSPLAFGVTGPLASPAVTSGQTRNLVRAALARGITVFDTGPAYGNGRAERRLGEALRGVREERICLMTKAGIHAGRRRDFSPGGIEMSLKESLDRLDRKRVDILWLHGPAPDELTPALFRHLSAFQARGLFGCLGVCGRGVELDAAIEMDEITALMAPVHSCLGDAEIARLERAKARGMTVMGIEALAGSVRQTRLSLRPADLWYLARRVKQGLTGSVPQETGLNAQTALQWALDRPYCDCVVSTTTNPVHLATNAALAGLEPDAKPA